MLLKLCFSRCERIIIINNILEVTYNNEIKI